MQHDTLVSYKPMDILSHVLTRDCASQIRDSEMDDVRAVPRKAKPKASRAKNAEAARASSVASTSSSILPPTRPSQSALSSKTKSARTARTKTAKPAKKSAYVESDDDEDELDVEPSIGDVEGVGGNAASDMEIETMGKEEDDDLKIEEDANIDVSQPSTTKQDAIIIAADSLTAPPPIPLDMPKAPPPLAPAAMSIPIPGAQNSEMADGTTYASLPKSLQEAFLILDNLTPTPTLEHSQDDAEMIDPSLVPDLDTSKSTLPPLPPTSTSSLSSSKPVSTASSDGTDISTEATLTAAQRAYLAAAMQPPPTLPQPFYYQQETGPHFMQTEAAALSLPGHFRLTSPHIHRDQ